MKNYDFQALNDKEFEILCADLLSRRLGESVERFKPGKDEGVDGRFFQADGGETIIQCKHWIKSGLSPLLRHLEQNEFNKVILLRPARYILATSLPLSRNNKRNILRIFSPFIRSESDVFGNEDINDMLAKYEEVERQHYKLWITSTGVLATLLNSAIVGRSREKLAQIREASMKYVITSSHQAAFEKLNDKHAIIITGSPGVGKTYLAEQLCQYYAANGFQFVSVENSLNEAEAVYDETREQIFYYDDFLGGNFIQALGHHQDSHIINFIKRVKRDSSKRFILTTRTNIFNLGKYLSDKFVNEKIDKDEFILSVENLTLFEKANILYNHLWHGNLDEEKIDQLYQDKRYLKIIEHSNFNPRLIAFITDSDRLEGMTPAEYWPYLHSALTNPMDIWRHVFDAQLDVMPRHIVVAICCNGSKISEHILEECFQRLDSSPLGAGNRISFRAMMKVLTGALINRSIIFSGVAHYTLFNPSIADFVIVNYLQSATYIDKIVSALQTAESLDFVHSLAEAGVIKAQVEMDFLHLQLNRLVSEERGQDLTPYVLRLIKLLIMHGTSNELLNSAVVSLVDREIIIYRTNLGQDFYDICRWCIERELITSNEPKLHNYCSEAIASECNDRDELVSLSKLVKAIDENCGALSSKFSDELERFLSDNITYYVDRDNVQPNVYYPEDYDYLVVVEYVEASITEFSIGLSSEQIEYVADSCDRDQIVENNRETVANSNHNSGKHFVTHSSGGKEIDKITDLFDRSGLR